MGWLKDIVQLQLHSIVPRVFGVDQLNGQVVEKLRRLCSGIFDATSDPAFVVADLLSQAVLTGYQGNGV